MRLTALAILCLIFITGCERQMPTGIPPRDATLIEMSRFDGRWQLAKSNPGDESLPFEIVTVSSSGQRVTVDHPNAVASVRGGEYFNTGPYQFVELTLSVAFDADEYELVIRRPEEPDARMFGRLSGGGTEPFQMVRVRPVETSE